MKYFSGRLVLARAEHTEKSIAIDWEAVEDDVLFGGSPIDENGRVVNDSTAVGILAYNVWRGRDLFAPVIIGGYIDIESAQENCGFEISDEAKSAMPNVWFSDAGPRGGSSVGAVSWNDLEDKPFYKSETVKAEFNNAAFTNQGDIYCEFDISNAEVADGDTLIFDGESYKLETAASGYSMSGSGDVWIMGNPAIVSILYDNSDWDIFESFDDNGLPFAIVIRDRYGAITRTIYSKPSTLGDNHSFKIFNSVIKTLSPELGGVPTPTAEDEGKVLMSVNGVPTWVALTNVAQEGA